MNKDKLAKQPEKVFSYPMIMKFAVLIISLLLFVQNGFACTVSIYDIKATLIFGKVIDSFKNVVPNAKIQIYRNLEEGEEILAETKADENGIFEVENFKLGKYMIRANYEDIFTYSYASLKLKKTSNKKKTKEIIFTLVPYGECSGTVEIKRISKVK